MSFSVYFLRYCPFSACLFLSSSTLCGLLHLLFFDYHAASQLRVASINYRTSQFVNENRLQIASEIDRLLTQLLPT